MNNDVDSSDSENDNNDDEEHSSDDELSFESDDEGNYQQNLNKKHYRNADSDSEADKNDEDEEEDDEDEEDEEVDEEASENELGDNDDVDDEEVDDEEIYESDGSEELSFEEDSEQEDEPSTSSKKPSSAKQNGTAKQKSKSKSKSNGVNSKNENKSISNKNDTGADEYEKHDTDDEEDIRNTVGNIPMHWYDEYKHIGYDWDAKKIIKPTKRDQLDDFLKRMEDPNFWRTVKDPQTGQDVVLSEADIDLIKRINSQRIPDANFDDYTVCDVTNGFSGNFFINLNSIIFRFFFLFKHSRGLIGLHLKWKKCQFGMCLITSVHSYRRCRKRKRCRDWCTPSKWVG